MRGDFLDQIPCDNSLAALLILRPATISRRFDAVWVSYRTQLTEKPPERIEINLPSTWTLYERYFGSRGYVVRPSDKLSYTNALFDLAGGLGGGAVFRSRVAAEILDLLSDKSTKKLAQEIKRQVAGLDKISVEDVENAVAAAGAIPRYQRVPYSFLNLYSMLKSKLDHAQCLQILSALVNVGAIHRGFNITCPRCNVTLWYGLNNLSERITCAGCLTPFPLPLAASSQAKEDLPVQYALNPLTNRAMDQDVLPVLLALETLREIHPQMYHVAPGVAFRPAQASAVEGDFDFLYVYKSALYAGECKSGGRVSEKDISTTLRVARAVGIRAFFFVSLAGFSEESLRLIEQAASAGDRDDASSCQVFIIEVDCLFGEASLPKSIPR